MIREQDDRPTTSMQEAWYIMTYINSEICNNKSLTAPTFRERQMKVPRLLRRIEIILGQGPRVYLDTYLCEHAHYLVLDRGAERITLD